MFVVGIGIFLSTMFEFDLYILYGSPTSNLCRRKIWPGPVFWLTLDGFGHQTQSLDPTQGDAEEIKGDPTRALV